MVITTTGQCLLAYVWARYAGVLHADNAVALPLKYMHCLSTRGSQVCCHPAVKPSPAFYSLQQREIWFALHKTQMQWDHENNKHASTSLIISLASLPCLKCASSRRAPPHLVNACFAHKRSGTSLQQALRGSIWAQCYSKAANTGIHKPT